MTQDLVIEWAKMPVYNTIMAVATGAALMSLARAGKQLVDRDRIEPQGWALNLGVLGLLLFLTGLHMTLTWPLAAYFPFDNIVFGEPTLALGALLMALSFFFWKKAGIIKQSDHPIKLVSEHLKYFKYFLYGIGLGLIGIGIAGVTYQLFAAPPKEPITGLLADYPMVEAVFISLLWALTGVACILFSVVMEHFSKDGSEMTNTVKITYGLTYFLGLTFLLFGAFNYFTHIGLIVNTMPK